MHDVDRRGRKAKAVQRDVQLNADGAGRTIGGVRAFDDHHGLLRDAACAQPVAEHLFVQAAAIDKTGVKGIAARLPPGIPNHSAFGQGVAVVAAKDQLRHRLRHTMQCDLGHFGQAEGEDSGKEAVGGGLFGEGLVAQLAAPFVQRFIVADAVGMAWRGIRGLQQTVRDGARDMLGLEREQHPGVAQGFAAGFAADRDVDGRVRRPDIAARHPRVADGDLAQGAADHSAAVHVARHRDRDFGGKARGKGQKPERGGIDAGFRKSTGAFDRYRVVEGGVDDRACDEAGERSRIAAHVQNAATAQGQLIKAGAFAVGGVETEMGLDVLRHTNLTRRDDLQHPGDLGVQAVHERFHEQPSALCGDLGHGGNFGGVHAGGLFAQHMLAGAQGGDGQFRVPGMRRCDIDRVDLIIRQDRRITGMAMRVGDGIFVAERFAPRGIAAGNRHQFAGLRLRQTVGEIVGDAARPDDSPANCHGRPPLMPQG